MPGRGGWWGRDRVAAATACKRHLVPILDDPATIPNDELRDSATIFAVRTSIELGESLTDTVLAECDGSRTGLLLGTLTPDERTTLAQSIAVLSASQRQRVAARFHLG